MFYYPHRVKDSFSISNGTFHDITYACHLLLLCTFTDDLIVSTFPLCVESSKVFCLPSLLKALDTASPVLVEKNHLQLTSCTLDEL